MKTTGEATVKKKIKRRTGGATLRRLELRNLGRSTRFSKSGTRTKKKREKEETRKEKKKKKGKRRKERKTNEGATTTRN